MNYGYSLKGVPLYTINKSKISTLTFVAGISMSGFRGGQIFKGPMKGADFLLFITNIVN